jgi:4-hydroxybenzoate polyprenyltransferase
VDAPNPRRSLPLALLVALRPKQWTKNALLFAALVFSARFTETRYVVQSCVACAAFCLLSSTGYVYNDLRDVEGDRRHPKKRFRPLAAGEVGTRGAWLLMAACTAVALALAAWLGPWFVVVALAYFATTLSYSLYFKHHVILDVMMLASCYIWRAAAGAVAIDARISSWLLVCTAFGALFLGFNKRRGELLLLEGKVAGTRKSLAHYSPAMLMEFQAITTSGTIISYALYTVEKPWLGLTLPYVLYGVFRYIYLIDQKGEGAAPDETLLRDRPIQVTAILFVLTAVVVMILSPVPPVH